MAVITKEQFAQLNLGYLRGADLLHFCPDQLLISQYNRFPGSIQEACSMAYDEVSGELANVYDICREIYNGNQSLKNKTGAVTIDILSGSYVNRISMTWVNPLSEDLVLGAYPSVAPTVKIGSTVGAEDIMSERVIDVNLIYYLNKIYTSSTTLYLTIAGGYADIDVTADTGVKLPAVSLVTFLGKSDNFELIVPANTYIYQIFASILLSAPTVKIGTSEGDDDILAETTIADAVLAITQQYFEDATTLYFTLSGGSANFRLDVGYNFTAPAISTTIARNWALVKALSIYAIRNCVGNLAGENKILESHYEQAERLIEKMKESQFGLPVAAAPKAVNNIGHMASSSFKTLG